MSDSKKIVWIVGAGASRPLSGPLLSDWLQPYLLKRMSARYNGHLAKDRTADVFRSIAEGYAPPSSPDTLPETVDVRKVAPGRSWQNAEEFIALIERAATDSSPETEDDIKVARAELASTKIELAVNGQWKDLQAAARRYIVYSSEFFLPANDAFIPKQDRWSPYVRWTEELTENDVVVTFNYDRVIEAAARHAKPKPDSRIDRTRLTNPILPSEVTPDLVRQPFGIGPLLLKLHGSVLWSQSADAIKEHLTVEDALQANDGPAIGVPGHQKLEQMDGLFKPLWDCALQAIRSADAVVFVGYRFPESDAFARIKILEKIRELATPRSQADKLPIRVVLGAPGQGNESDIARIVGLLHWGVGRFHLSDPASQIIVEPMGAQDFYSAFRRNELHYAKRAG